MPQRRESGRYRAAPEGPEVQKLRALVLRKRGKTINSIKELEKKFRRGDGNGDGNLSRAEFKVSIVFMEKGAEIDVQKEGPNAVAAHVANKFTEDELDRLYDALDFNRRGFIRFNHFFYAIKVSFFVSPFFEL